MNTVAEQPLAQAEDQLARADAEIASALASLHDLDRQIAEALDRGDDPTPLHRKLRKVRERIEELREERPALAALVTRRRQQLARTRRAVEETNQASGAREAVALGAVVRRHAHDLVAAGERLRLLDESYRRSREVVRQVDAETGDPAAPITPEPVFIARLSPRVLFMVRELGQELARLEGPKAIAAMVTAVQSSPESP